MIKDSTLDYISSKPDIAKYMLRGMAKEIKRLQGQVAKATGFDGETGLMEEVEEWLIEKQLENELLKKKVYGRSSEKRSGSDDQEDEHKDSGQDKPKSRARKKKPKGSGRGEVGKDLPLFTEEYNLKKGATCHCPLKSPAKKIKKTVVTEMVDYVPAKLIKRKIVRQMYRASKCGCRLTAPGPTTLVDGGQYGIDLATEIVVRKFQDQLPWERQSKAFLRDGMMLSSTTLWNQSRHVANLLTDVYERLRKDVESGGYRHGDETGWRVLQGVALQTQQAWVFRNSRSVYFTIEDSRSGEIPLKILPEATGALVADDYGGYNALVARNELVRVQCWAHTRRKFVVIREIFPGVDTFLDLVRDLYQKDREFRNSGELTAKRRQEMCGPIIEAIDVWRKNQSCLPRSALGKALNYLNDNWDGLTVFLDDPMLPLDNNPAEQALRQLVLGRKNFLFNRSLEGARVSAILYSICVSCALNGVDPKAYLKETLLRIRNCRGFQLPYEFANDPEHLGLI